VGRTRPCLDAWNSGPRAAGVLAAVTEAAAMCGSELAPGESAIKCKSSLNVLEDTYAYSCY
jgi:hypothetical protein